MTKKEIEKGAGLLLAAVKMCIRDRHRPNKK